MYTFDTTINKLAYCLSTENGAYVRRAHISVLQTAIDTQVWGAISPSLNPLMTQEEILPMMAHIGRVA